jgi:hypothetical protein
MLPNKFDNVSPEKRAEIERDLMSQYVERMDAEASKTAAQLEAEKLDSEIGQITQQIHQALGDPLANRKQIAELKQKLGMAESRYGELTGKKLVDKTLKGYAG